MQPKVGGKLWDCRAESDPYLGRLPGEEEERLLIDWSHRASEVDRHWCTGALSSFTRHTPGAAKNQYRQKELQCNPHESDS